MPAKEFYDGLEPRDQERLRALFERFAQEGWIANGEHFKKLAGTELWEFKRFQVRMLCCMKGPEAVLCYGLIKKQDRHRSSDLRKAEQLCAEDKGNHESPSRRN